MNERPTVSATFLDATHLQNLEQLDDEEFWEYARRLAQQAPASAQSEEYLACILAQGTCLIPLTALNEVVLPPHHLTLLPATPEWMPGLVAWRGEAIAVIDLSLFLSNHTLDLSNGILLVANHAGLPIGLLVPSIGQTIPVQQELEDTPTPASDNFTHSTETMVHGLTHYAPDRAACVKGIQQGALVLDLPVLLAAVTRHIERAAANG
jgi:chemotaxis signal transduction protein